MSWGNQSFLDVVLNTDDNAAAVDCMEHTKNAWKWPAEKSILHNKWRDIKRKIPPATFIKWYYFQSRLLNKVFT